MLPIPQIVFCLLSFSFLGFFFLALLSLSLLQINSSERLLISLCPEYEIQSIQIFLKSKNKKPILAFCGSIGGRILGEADWFSSVKSLVWSNNNMEGIQHPIPRTVEEVFSDFRGRRAGLIKALSTGQLDLSLSLSLFILCFFCSNLR